MRRCLVALAPDDNSTSILVRLFDYRFNGGGGLSGHSFGNLLLSALTEVTGDTATAISEAGTMLGIKGKVLPVTLTKTSLVAHLKDGSEIREEANIDLRGSIDGAEPIQPIDYVYLDPPAYAYRPAAEAWKVPTPSSWDQGHLHQHPAQPAGAGHRRGHTVLQGPEICVSNLMTKPGESDSFKASDFARLSREYLGTSDKLDCLIVNNSPFPKGCSPGTTPTGKPRWKRIGKHAWLKRKKSWNGPCCHREYTSATTQSPWPRPSWIL